MTKEEFIEKVHEAAIEFKAKVDTFNHVRIEAQDAWQHMENLSKQAADFMTVEEQLELGKQVAIQRFGSTEEEAQIAADNAKQDYDNATNSWADKAVQAG